MSDAMPEAAPWRDDLLLARELALRAGGVLRRHWGALRAGDIRYKSRRDPVTLADLESEAKIVEELRRRRPEDAILAEEGGAQGPADASRARVRWTIDPLDGTVNYQYGLPLFAVSIAKSVESRPVVGVVYLPMLGEMYCATQGGGATLNGAALAVREPVEMADALLATGFAYRRDELADDNVQHVVDLLPRCRDLRRLGSAAADLAFLAAGRYDGFWELHLSPWDMAAGRLLVTEAGGVVTDLQGGDDPELTRSIVAAGPTLHPELLAILQRRS